MKEHALAITYLGHSTTLIDFGEDCVLTDPLLRDRVWHLRRHSANFTHLLHPAPPTVVLLSHLHGDHTDPDSLRSLPAHIPVLAPAGSGRYLRRVIPQPVIEIAAGQRTRIGGLEIEAYPADHPSFSPPPRPSVDCLIFVVCGHSRVLFIGDSALFDGLSAVNDHHVGERHGRIDAALLPVAGYSPRLGPGHFNPYSAALACQMIRPRVAIPIHWGTFRPVGPRWSQMPYLSQPPHEFVAFARRMAPEVDSRILQPGQMTEIARRTET